MLAVIPSKLSDQLNARRFQIPPDVWGNMNEAERWAANQKFLDRTIGRVDEYSYRIHLQKQGQAVIT